MPAQTLLDALCELFADRHCHPPQKVVLTPEAAAALAARGELAAPVDVETRHFEQNEVARPGEDGIFVGVFLKDGERLASVSLKA